MKSSDQKTLEDLYVNQVLLNEGVWDTLKKVGGAVADKVRSQEHTLANVGNRVANVFRGGEDQKNPVEAQVQSVWNRLQETVKKNIDGFMQKQSHLLDAENNMGEDDTIVTKQIDAIKEARKFLESPATYLRANRANRQAAQSNEEGQAALPSNERPGLPAPAQQQLALPAPQAQTNTSSTQTRQTASVAQQPLDASSEDAPTGSPPEVKKKATEILQKLRKQDKSVYNEIVKRVKYNLARNAKRKAARDAKSNPAIPESLDLSNDTNLIEALDSGCGGLDFLFEYAMTREVANRVRDTANREGEDIRFHGARPIQVEIMKFFENFRQAATAFWENYDKVTKEGTYNRSTASREKFFMIEAFFKQLHRILYIPNAENLQGKDPFVGRVK